MRLDPTARVPAPRRFGYVFWRFELLKTRSVSDVFRSMSPHSFELLWVGLIIYIGLTIHIGGTAAQPTTWA